MDDQDAELRGVFAEEARERLDSMARLLLELESSGSDPELLAGLFREAHTLKGGAAMVGLEAVGHLAHAMEDLLTPVREGSLAITSELTDALLAAADALGSIIPAAVRGEPQEAAVEAAIGALRDHVASPSSSPVAQSSPSPALRDPPLRPSGPPPPQGGRGARGEERLAVPAERLDELVRLVGETVAGQLRLGALLQRALGRDPEGLEEFRAFTHVLQELQDVAMQTRMVPIGRAVPGLRRAVRDVARASGKQVRFEVSGGDTELDRRVLDQLAEALLHLVRNAVDHGSEPPEERRQAGKEPEGVISLQAEQRKSEVVVVVSDDGRGIDLDRVREAVTRAGGPGREMGDEEAMHMIFSSGFSTSAKVDEVSGRGVGLDVVRSSLELIQGRVTVKSQPGAGTQFRIAVPITLAVVSSLLVAAGGQRFALPMHSVVSVLPPEPEERWAGGRPIVLTGGAPVPLADLAATLGLEAAPTDAAAGPTVLLAGHAEQHGFTVQQVLGQRQVVVKSLSQVLPRLPAVVGASVEPDGPILLMLEATALIERALERRPRTAGAAQAPSRLEGTSEPSSSSRILVVDDARIVREVERSILEQAGYEVVTASDGMEALAELAERPCDLVVSDIEMPRMDGLELTSRIRGMPRLAQLPVILLTSRPDEDTRRRGLEAGADGYVVKSGFDRLALLGMVEKALGR